MHQWPELAFQEHKTSAFIARELESLGIPCETGIAGTGVVGRLINAHHQSPTVALRADMDALLLHEETGLPFSSQVKGVMHACGHDGHIAMVLGAAALLKENPPDGNVVFIFQPAEEGGAGALEMVKAGVLDGVDAIFGGHIDRHLSVGQIVAEEGANSASTDELDIIVTGRGGHAARPHETVDAVVVASMLVMTLQTIVSRQIDPVHPSVITIGRLCSGTARNVIAERAEIEGTIRTTDEGARQEMITHIKRMTQSMASLYNAHISAVINEGYPPVINTPHESEIARQAIVNIVGKKGITPFKPILGGEDFSYYLQKIPGAFVRLGASREGLENIPSHSPRFDFDEEVLAVGARFFSEVVRLYIDYKRNNREQS